LILAFGINRPLPELSPRFGREINHGARQNGVSGAIGGEDEAYGFEGFADDEGDAVFGSFQKKFTMDAR